MKHILSLVIVFFLAFPSLAEETEPELHLDPALGFGFFYPKEWRILSPAPGGTHILMLGPSRDGSTPTVSITLEPADRNILTITQPELQKQLEAKFRDVRIRDFGFVNIDEKHCRIAHFQGTTGETTSEFFQTVFLHSGKTFTVTATDMQTNFDNNADLFTEIMDSFLFLKDTNQELGELTPAVQPVTVPKLTAAQQAEADKLIEEHGKDVLAHYMLRAWINKDIDENLLLAYASYFISKGADVNAKDRFGVTSLHSAVLHLTTQHLAGRDINIEVIKFLISQRADVNAKATNTGATPLHTAAGAVHSGVEVTKYLISQGANVHAKNNDGKTPLDIAKEKGNTAVANYLSSLGKQTGAAVPTASAQARQPAASNAPLAGYTSIHSSIFRAVENGTLNDVRFFVEKEGVSVNARGAGNLTPLHCAACQNSDVEILKYLVTKGANINDAKNEFGETPLHFAVRDNSNIDVVKYLVSQKANINAKDNRGRTPLHLAAGHKSNKVEVLKYLISQGADVNAKNNDGRTPLDESTARWLHNGERMSHIDNEDFLRSVISSNQTRQSGGGRATLPYQQAADAVIPDRDQATWNRLKREHSFARDFVNAGDQVFRSGSVNALRNFARIQQRYTGNAIDID
jgi:ankyrin repeat protein